MHILVTGATGFIGTHLVPGLEADGHEVTASDRADADLAIVGEARRLVETTSPDQVIHLAARYGRLLCRDEPHRAVADNTAATAELASTCATLGIPVLYASSSEVYGDHGTETITEDSELRTPTTIYGLSKRWGEEVLRLYLPPEQLCIARLNMLYGPKQRGGYGCCALATFIRDGIEGRPLTVHTGTSRSWLYITDAVRALKLLVGRQGVWNIGNADERLETAEIARMVCQEVGGEIRHVDPPASQIAHKNYDSSKLEALGWHPEVSLLNGIRLTAAAALVDGIRDYEMAA